MVCESPRIVSIYGLTVARISVDDVCNIKDTASHVPSTAVHGRQLKSDSNKQQARRPGACMSPLPPGESKCNYHHHTNNTSELHMYVHTVN